MDNITTGKSTDRRNFWGLRGKIHYDDSDRWDVVLTGGHTDSDNDGFVTTSYDATAERPIPTGDDRTTATPLDTDGRTKTDFASAHVTIANDGFTVRSITGWSKMKDGWRVDLTGGIATPSGAYTTGYLRESAMKRHQWSQESQIFGDALGDATWIAGVYLFHEETSQSFDDAFYLRAINLTIPVPTITYTIGTYSYAGYAQGTYKLTPKLEAVIGGRYTLEDKKITGTVNPTTPFGDHQSYNAFTPKFGLNYQATPNIFLYGTVSRGFKAGSYSGGSTTVEVAEAGYRPEKVWAYEIGAKTELFDRHVKLNLAGFINDFTDVVSGRFIEGTGIVVLYNGQSYRTSGLEAELTIRPVDGLSLYANGGWQRVSNAKFVAGSQDTKPASQPKYSGTTGFRYEFPIVGDYSLRFGADYTFRDGFFGSSAQTPVTYYSKINELGAEVTLMTHGGWQLSATGHNLTNTTEWKNSLDLVSFLGVGSRALPLRHGRVTCGHYAVEQSVVPG
jgi:iron complex outermembrane receptor protein